MDEPKVYRVVFECPPCKERHHTGILMRFPNSALDGRPLSEAYPLGRDISEEIKAFDPNVVRCNGRLVTPEADQFFLEIPRQ
jgi:hypothetical protein